MKTTLQRTARLYADIHQYLTVYPAAKCT